MALLALTGAGCGKHASSSSQNSSTAPNWMTSGALGGSGASGAGGTGQSASDSQTGAEAGSAQAISERLSGSNVDSEDDFSPAHGIECSPGGGQDHFAIRCHAMVFDSERSAQTANLDFLIYDAPADFSAEDARLAKAVQNMPNRWTLDEQPDISYNGPVGAVKLPTSCHQALGANNSPAICLAQADPRVLVVAAVAPAQSSTDSLIVGTASNNSGDTSRAATLVSLGAIHVAKTR